MILTGSQMPVGFSRWLLVQLVQDNKKARDGLKDTVKYLDEMLSYVSEEIKLLREAQSLTNASMRPLARLEQMGNEFVRHLEDLKDDLNKIYRKTGIWGKMKKAFQSKAILDCINQHKVYVKDARDKLVATAVLPTARQVTDIHNHLMSPFKIQPVNSIMPSAIPPPAPSVFLGRDDLVQEGIANLLADSPDSIIIMGFGGMGKTSLALKILNNKAVQAKYKNDRYFIPCDIVFSVSPTIEVLLQTVMKLMNLDLTGDAVKQLHTISKPTILVFDNFETLWDQSSDQYSIQMLLAQLNSIIHITLMITMRGSIAPIEDIDWLILHKGLLPIDESTSLDIFNVISQHTIDEEAVIELVKELEGWPLAITLIAYQAKILSPKIHLNSWYQEKTLLLQRPGVQAY
ncbi:P-loop containing nucleoside triphosphate hydrolase protein [Armillaria fumosa]|nr:P-loop containing nucleoside triphosphate hydrolase protein [Armillaria fumosa]